MPIQRRLVHASANAALVFCIALLFSAPCGAATLTMGVLGDSMSAGTGSSYGEFPNWLTQLSNAGKFTLPSGADAAVGGARVAYLTGQFNSSGFQAALPSLNYAVVIMGGNDATAMGLDPSTIPTFIHDVVADIASVMNAIHTANPAAHRIVATVPDVFVTLLVQQYVAQLGITPGQISAAEAAIQVANSQIIAFAINNQIPVIDLYAATATVTPLLPSAQTGLIASGSVVIDGYTFSTTTGLFSSDKFHPGPIVQGLLANMVIGAADKGYAAGLSALSDQTLVQTVGKKPVGGPTFYNVSPYVLVPEPSSLVLAGTALALASGRAIRRRLR
jgi:lysophospholipase L1-like esterase